ncbi:MAG TPA: glycosyltransferase [Bacteroidia bacterium]
MRVGVFLIVGNVDGGGGVERQFINFVLNNTADGNKVDIITTSTSKKNILALNPGFPQDRIKALPSLNNRFNKALTKMVAGIYLFLNRYKVIHIANYDSYYQYLYEFLGKRTKLTLNLIDCRFTPEINDKRYNKVNSFLSDKRFLDGVFSWYKNTEEAINKLNDKVYFEAASYCFTDYELFKKEQKEKTIVFAARLSKVKRPEDYLEAVSILYKRRPELFNEWKFLLWGNGEILEEVKKKVNDHGLERVIRMGYSKHMNEIFNRSSIFVSTQMYENFTSLSMLEAMASGNAIVSYNVGQTDCFVKNGENGILTNENPHELAAAMETLMDSPGTLEAYQQKSYELSRKVHNYENFSRELFGFWNKILNN